jgi:hypothetical protein
MTRSARLTGILGLLVPLFASAQETSAPVQPAVPAPLVVQAEPELSAVVQVTGVDTLVDYAAVGRLLGAVEGVRRVDVTEANGTTVTFRVLVRGGSATLDRALEGSPQLARSAASGGRLVYEYQR